MSYNEGKEEKKYKAKYMYKYKHDYDNPKYSQSQGGYNSGYQQQVGYGNGQGCQQQIGYGQGSDRSYGQQDEYENYDQGYDQKQYNNNQDQNYGSGCGGKRLFAKVSSFYWHTTRLGPTTADMATQAIDHQQGKFQME